MGEGYEGTPLEELRILEVDWKHRGDHIRNRSARKGRTEFDIEPHWATEAALDPNRIVGPTGGRSIKVIGMSRSAPPRRPGGLGRVLKVWIVPRDLDNGRWWGASAADANESDERVYRERNR